MQILSLLNFNQNQIQSTTAFFTKNKFKKNIKMLLVNNKYFKFDWILNKKKIVIGCNPSCSTDIQKSYRYILTVNVYSRMVNLF